MDEADLAGRLHAETRPRAVTALPDGSVDSYYEVYGDRDERIASAADFAEQVAGGNVSFRVSRAGRIPGGQAVNMARQAHALADDVTLFGHLDDPAFAELDFETRSMGDPTAVRVLDFGGEEVLLADDSPDVRDWTLADLESVAADLEDVLTPDAVCCGNWASVEGMSETFRTLGSRSLDGEWFVLDPGNVAAADPERVRDLADALGVLADTYDVGVSANRPELAAIVERVGEIGRGSDDGEIANDMDDPEIVAAVRSRTAATAVVMHEKDVAVAATPEGVRRVPNFEARDAHRPTGAGDCFTAALVHALVRGWDWSAALGLANLAAVYRVETGETGDRASLRTFLEDHGVKKE